MKFFFVFLIFTKILFCQDLQFLLDNYKLETSNLISEKTKKELKGSARENRLMKLFKNDFKIK